ncbi:MAG: hypothetical protein BalsKO_20700 [Balneolaceae bacterium]
MSSGQSQEYLWPTDASQHLTSTFGETRSAHFHSGLDIKTWGREGYKVFASKDGVVYRLGISVEGYGKVIYLKHDDGTYTVYAHLQRMNEELQAYVDSVRMTDYSFETQLYIEEQNIQVSQGDVIGFTGSTGVGPPHLHFEIRDSSNNPINALLSNLKVEDDYPPTFSALLVFPLTKNTTIRGSRFPQIYYPSRTKEDEINFGTVTTNGTIGLSISTFDEANRVNNKYAVYELGLISGEDTLFYQRLNDFRFEDDDVMFTDRIPAFGATRRSYQTLFKKDGPENPFYKINDPRTFINPGDSLANFTIFAKDYYGNETKAHLIVDGGMINSSKINEETNKHLNDWYWTEDWAFTGSDVIDFEEFNLGALWDSSLSQRISFSNFGTVLWSRFKPNEAFSIHTPDRNLFVRFPEDSFFDTLTVSVSHGTLNGYPYINLQPEMIPTRKELKVEYYISEGFRENENFRLFRLKKSDNSISYVDSKLIGRTVHATPSGLGEFLVIPDNEPPVLEMPQIIQMNNGKWVIQITAIDSLTGINFQNSKIHVNGVRGIVEFDNEENLLIYYHPNFIPKKDNIITVKISDNAGNFFTGSYQL